jgi:transposase
MRCSSDLRARILAYVRSGGSKAEAARRFCVSRASIHNWLAKEDGLAYEKPGPKESRKLDRTKLSVYITTHDDRTHAELARVFGVSRHCIWYNMQRLDVTRKKNGAIPGSRHYEKAEIPTTPRAVRTPR